MLQQQHIETVVLDIAQKKADECIAVLKKDDFLQTMKQEQIEKIVLNAVMTTVQESLEKFLG